VWIDLILGNDFLTTIASIRALNKLLQSKFTNISFRIQTRLDEGFWNQDHHTHLMISSLSSLASSIAGVSTIWCSGARFLTLNADLSKIRNLLHVQHILKNESFLNRVIDPGAGSYYFEDLTEKIFLKLYELY
jgi:methylmalonyl-CoA mutase